MLIRAKCCWACSCGVSWKVPPSVSHSNSECLHCFHIAVHTSLAKKSWSRGNPVHLKKVCAYQVPLIEPSKSKWAHSLSKDLQKSVTEISILDSLYSQWHTHFNCLAVLFNDQINCSLRELTSLHWIG